MNTLLQILQNKIVAIIRGADPNDAVKIAHALNEGGIKVLEVTMNSEDALSVIKKISKEISSGLLIGAGTVLNVTMVKDAVAAGAKFIISPSFEPEVIAATKDLGAVSIPGAFTPTEILSAYKHGGDIIKVFPAPGSQYIKDIRGPLPHIPLMPTGGINFNNIGEYFKAGAVAVGIGSALVDTKREITGEYLSEIKSTAAKYVEAVNNILFDRPDV